MQEHTPVSLARSPAGDALVVLPAGRRRIKVLMLVGWSRPRGGSPHCGSGLWPSPTALAQQVAHLLPAPDAPARMSGRGVMSRRVRSGCQGARPAARPCTILHVTSARSVALDPSSSCHTQGAVTIHGAARAGPDEARRLCGFIMLRPKAGEHRRILLLYRDTPPYLQPLTGG